MVRKKLAGEPTERRGRQVPGESSARIPVVVGGRESQCFSRVTTMKGRKKTWFYKQLCRRFRGAMKSICRGGNTLSVRKPLWGHRCIPLASHRWLRWRIQHSSLSNRARSQKTSENVEDLSNTFSHGT